ncbi:MAG TPA: adenylate/guanylate cyclase domain-containing protein [Verrucomicrobiae bacterium]
MPRNEGTEQRKLAAIMFTDMVGYSALAQRDEALALELLEEHRSLLRGLFPKHQGTEIKTTGDGFLVEFASALAAARCAIEIQRSLVTRNVACATDRQLQVRIGIHVGDVVHEEGDVLGDGVNIASRIEPLAGPGGICLSRPVVDQIANKIDASLVKLGTPELKNIQVPMEVYRVVLPWQQGQAEPPLQWAAERERKRSRTLVLIVTPVVLLAAVGGWLANRVTSSERQRATQLSSTPAAPLTHAIINLPANAPLAPGRVLQI